MRIVCDSCGAKYSIADEKISGKLFKVRCKKCDTMIMVDGTSLRGAVTVPPGTSGDVDAGWYVVIDGAQTGPLTNDEVIAQVHVGAVDATTFAWRDGMAGWLPLSDIAEFVGLLPQADPFEDEATRVASAGEFDIPSEEPALQPAPVPEPEPDISPRPSGSGLLSHSVNTAAGPSDFFGGAPAVAAAAAASPEAAAIQASADNPGGLTEERSESSVLFSLNDLTSNKAKASKDDLPRTDGSGLIDIRVLANTSALDAAEGHDSAAVPITPMALPPRKSNTGLVAAIGIGMLVMLGLIGVLVYIAFFRLEPTYPPAAGTEIEVAQNDGTEPAADGTGDAPVNGDDPAVPAAGSGQAAADIPPATLEGSGALAEGSGQTEPVEVASLDGTNGAEGTEADGEPAVEREELGRTEREETAGTEREEREEREEPAEEREEREEREEPEEREAAEDGPPEREERETDRSADAVGNALDAIRSQREEPEEAEPEPEAEEEGLSRDDVRSTIRRYRSQVARCDDGNGGRYSVRFTIQPSGSVTNARASESNDVSQCIVGVVRDMSFPEFSGNAVPVTYPFNL